MTSLTDKFNKILKENLAMGDEEITDAEALQNSMEDPDSVGELSNFDKYTGETKLNRNIKEWRNRISDFLRWINEDETKSLRVELAKTSETHPAVYKETTKMLEDVAKTLGAMNQQLYKYLNKTEQPKNDVEM